MERAKKLDDEVARKQWCAELAALCQRHNGNQWVIGDLYNRGRQAFGADWCRQLTDSEEWRLIAKLDYDSLKQYAWVTRRFPEGYRYLNSATFTAHHEAASLPTLEQRMELMADVVRYGWKTNKVRIEARWRSRTTGFNGTDIVDGVKTLIGRGSRYRVIYADPPWDWTGRPGKRGSSDGRYPLLPLEQLSAIRVPQIATADSLLFMWCSAANLETHGLPLLRAWAYKFVTHGVWDKQELGTGSYFRMEHEDLLLGAKPSSPTHFDDSTIGSMIRQRRSRLHSEKPALHDLIPEGNVWSICRIVWQGFRARMDRLRQRDCTAGQ